MRIIAIYFILGAIAALLFMFLAPTLFFNLNSLLFGGGWVKLSQQCDAGKTRCIFIRVENGLGVNDVPVTAIYQSMRGAAVPSLISRRIECDPGAAINFEWQDAKLLLSSKDGLCQFRGAGVFGFEIQVIDR